MTDAAGDGIGHTLARAMLNRGFLAGLHRADPAPGAIEAGHGSAEIARFLDWARGRGTRVIGGWPTEFADAPPDPRLAAVLTGLYGAHGAVFLPLANQGRYPRADFFDSQDHLATECQAGIRLRLPWASRRCSGAGPTRRLGSRRRTRRAGGACPNHLQRDTDAAMPDHLEGLNEQQAMAVAAPAPQLVLAGAGSGKTETLARRAIDLILRHDERPDRLLCITFTNRAAAEMRARMAAKLGLRAPAWVGTFHACMARLLTEDAGAIDGLPRGFAILDAARSRAVVGQVAGVRDPKLLLPLHEAMSLLRNYGLENGARPPRVPAFARFEGAVLAQALTVLPAYAAERRRLRALDFDDLLILPARAMADDAALAARWSGRWSEILVDEYQDTNAAQHRLLRLLASAHGRVFAVGDDSQSIYGWRGAEVTHIRRFGEDFPAAAAPIKLETNYRSTRTILAAANAISARDPDAVRKTLRPAEAAGTAGAAIMVRGCQTAEDEGRAVVGWVQAFRARQPAMPLRACAVLVRAGFVAEPILEALREAGLAVQLVSEREAEPPREVLGVIAWLRLALSRHPVGRDGEQWDPAADDAFRRTCAMPRGAIAGQAFARLRQHAGEVGEALAASVQAAPLDASEKRAFEAVLQTARRIADRIGGSGAKPSAALRVAAAESGLADAT